MWLLQACALQPQLPASPEKCRLVLDVQEKSRGWRTSTVIVTLHPNYGMHWGWDLQQLDFPKTFASFGYLCLTAPRESVGRWAPIESYSHIAGCVGKDLRDHLIPNHLQWAGTPPLDQITQGPIQPSLNTSRDWMEHSPATCQGPCCCNACGGSRSLGAPDPGQGFSLPAEPSPAGTTRWLHQYAFVWPGC